MKEIRVGWINSAEVAKILYFVPEKVSVEAANKEAPLLRCPAIQDSFRNTYLIRAPFDIHVGKIGDAIQPLPSGMSKESQQQYFRPDHPSGWRYPARPIIQVNLPFSFASDDPGVVMNQTPPYGHYTQWPGIMLGGSFDIHAWPARPINFAFEFQEEDGTLDIKRGDPLFYVNFSAPGLPRISVHESEVTEELKEARRHTTNIPAMVRGTRKLFEAMRLRRPRKVLKFKK